jgi:hypothetical protein
MSYYYVNYYLSYIVISGDGVRSCGFFNEPGYFGIILGLVLLSDKFEIKKTSNIILFLAGVTTMSLAFWVIFILGVFLQNIKSLSKSIFAILFAFSVFCVVNSVEFSNPVVSSFIERFQYDSSTGKFKGDNRSTEDFEMFFQRFMQREDAYFGKGSGYYSSLQYEYVSSYKSAILDWGIIGFCFTYGLLIFFALRTAHGNRNAFILVLCFAMSIYQRPGVFNMIYLLVLFGGIFYLKQNERSPSLLNVDKRKKQFDYETQRYE